MPHARWSIALAVMALAACKQEPVDAPAATASGATTEQASRPTVPVTGPVSHVLAIGDSLFAGYGIGVANSYPAQLEAALRASGHNVVITNAAVSGETSPAGAQRLAFALDAQEKKPDLVLLEFGGNDMLRTLPPAETRAAFEAMLGELKKRDIPVIVMGMRAPPNLGADYAREFDGIYPDLARKYGATLVPFWLQSIYQRPELFQNDRLHPTVEGVKVLVDATADQIVPALPSNDG